MSAPGVLVMNQYGKSKVRVLKLKPNPTGPEDLSEINIQCLLQGDGLDRAYTSDDNSRIVPTDTVRQTMYILANQHPIDPIEDFGVVVGRHFLGMYPWIQQVNLRIEQVRWDRMQLASGPARQGFLKGSNARRVVRLVVTRSDVQITSGIEDLVLLKTGGSGFVGFNKCKHTQLPEVRERMMVSAATATWKWGSKAPACYNRAFDAAFDALCEKFQDHYSPSVQYTLHRMGQAVLAAVPEIEEITLTMPNIHMLPYDVKRFGVKESGTVLLPTDEPQGTIVGTIKRTQSRL